MRHAFAILCLCTTVALQSQSTPLNRTPSQPAALKASESAAVLHQLPVRQVVLYKNGIGYFEHLGSVTDNQRVAIDFTSAQLNDVLQSITILDDNGGRIAGANYNSTTPLAEQLKSLSLAMSDDPSSTELFNALRGQRVEVTGQPGGFLTGRLMSIESKSEKGPGDTTLDKTFLTLVTTGGAVRVIELTPTLSVRPLDSNLQGQLDRYLELLSSTRSTGLRHLTLDALGTGPRQLHVSYISEVPIWKSTYRIVFPREDSGKAILQGWAVVDNTIGSDWDNVQLSLVAGAPQSFIQPLSQPLYLRRPEIAISTTAQTTPQTHEAAEEPGSGTISGIVTDQTGAVIPQANVTLTSLTGGTKAVAQTASNGAFSLNASSSGPYNLTVSARGFQTYVMRNISVSAENSRTVNVILSVGAASETVEVSADAISVDSVNANTGVLGGSGNGFGPGAGGNVGGGLYHVGQGIYAATNAIQAGDVSSTKFDDFFEYSLTQPVTIHKNESAMVPILQETLPSERVTLWSRSEPVPFRAVWLENTSKLTFDRGSFSIFESGVFAGQGLLDPIHPGEKRLLSYAADQAVHVREQPEASKREIREVHIHPRQEGPGLIVKRYAVEGRSTFVVSNSSEEPRTVVLEVPRVGNRTLTPDSKPAESAATLYRFRVAVPAHQSASQLIADEGYDYESWRINEDQDQVGALQSLTEEVPTLLDKLKPIYMAQHQINEMKAQLRDLDQKAEALTKDEARARENLTALKGNDVARRFVDELNRAEDDLQATRRQSADLQEKEKAAVESLRQTLLTLELDWSSSSR